MRVLAPIRAQESCCFPHLQVEHNMPRHIAFSAVTLLSPSPQALAKNALSSLHILSLGLGCATACGWVDVLGFAATQWETAASWWHSPRPPLLHFGTPDLAKSKMRKIPIPLEGWYFSG